MLWSSRLIAASWSGSWLAASSVAALALSLPVLEAARAGSGTDLSTLTRVCDPRGETAPAYPVVFTGTVQSVSQQRTSERRAGLPSWLPDWLPFARVEGPLSLPLVRFETTVRYKGGVHRHETVQWLAGGRPRAGAHYTVFASVSAGQLETDPCAPNTQVRFDPERYGLVGQPPLSDPELFAGWQAGALIVAIVMAAAGIAILLLGRARRQRR
jgi:hypothetical protein